MTRIFIALHIYRQINSELEFFYLLYMGDNDAKEQLDLLIYPVENYTFNNENNYIYIRGIVLHIQYYI